MNNMKQLTKEELQKQLKKIQKQEEKEMIEKHYPEFKKLIGRFFKSKNSYGSNEKSWWVYHTVTNIKPENIYFGGLKHEALCTYEGWNFKTCSEGRFYCRVEKSGYVHLLGKEISKKEFVEAYKKQLNNLPKIK